MLKMKIKLLLGVVLILIASTGATVAQTLSVSYKNQSLEAVLADLKQKTNYNFVYQKQIVQGAKPVTATFDKVELAYILDRVLYNNGLDYEIVKETVVIKKAERETFKKVVNGRKWGTVAGGECPYQGHPYRSSYRCGRRVFDPSDRRSSDARLLFYRHAG